MSWGLAARTLVFLLCTAAAASAAGSAPESASLCRAAVQQAELRHNIPRGLLLAIAEVETGRPSAADGRIEPWPWSANARNQPFFFASRQDAVAWTRQALRRGVASIDSGCLQVNLQQHPDAFASVDEAFDPARNADYAARFLRVLYAQTGNWPAAVGWYHSHTPLLADPYRARVEAVFVRAVLHRREEILVEMASAWSATRAGAAPGACDAVGDAARSVSGACAP
jgi:soluble lytic murein transglycosylase-like protein